jgi:hypothetical protein
MTYEQVKHLKPAEFKRLSGVRPETFQRMMSVLTPRRAGQRGGQPKLSVEDQLLMTLQYWREYRTYFHLAHSWGVHESTVCRTVQQIERLLTQSGAFRLPGKKQLRHPAEHDVEVIVVDVSETPIERPKKNSVATTAVKNDGIPSSHSLWLHSVVYKFSVRRMGEVENMTFDCSNAVASAQQRQWNWWLTRATRASSDGISIVIPPRKSRLGSRSVPLISKAIDA